MDSDIDEYSNDRITMLYDMIPFIVLIIYWYFCYKIFGVWCQGGGEAPYSTIWHIWYWGIWDAKEDLKYGIKMHGSGKLTKRDLARLRWRKKL